MIFKDSHYVPILRWKRAERVALRQLTNSVRGKITPLLELVPAVDNDPAKVSTDIGGNWGFSPFFLEFLNLPDLEAADLVSKVFHATQTTGLRPIPVTGLDRGRSYQLAVTAIVAKEKRGACIRLFPRDLNTQYLSYDLTRLLSRLGLNPEQVDLIVDYQLLADFAITYVELCRRIPNLARWRTFTVASGAFCKNLTEYPKNGQYNRNREDWLFWQSNSDAPIPRRPTYSDYSIQYAYYEEPPDRAKVSASIRYTSENHWVIMRGEALSSEGSPGSAQYAAHAQLLCERDEFCGAQFSAGDTYIDNLNKGLEGPGSPETLLRAGINHHITMVTNQLSRSVGLSTGDVPFLGRYPNQQPPRVERRLSRAAYNEAERLRQTRPTK